MELFLISCWVDRWLLVNLWILMVGLFRVSGGMIVLICELFGNLVFIIGLVLFSCWFSGVSMWWIIRVIWLLLMNWVLVCCRILVIFMNICFGLFIRILLMLVFDSNGFSGLKLVILLRILWISWFRFWVDSGIWLWEIYCLIWLWVNLVRVLWVVLLILMFFLFRCFMI